MVETRQAPWSIACSDRSGNGFRFWREEADGPCRFSYDPVQPHMSSSGTYSGGSDRHGTLEPAQTRALWRHVESLEGAAGDHTTTRRKGTTSLRVARGTRVREFIVDGGAAVGPFAAFLDQFRG